MRVLQADQHLEDLTSFVRRDLPPLNTSCRNRAAAGLTDWIRQVTPALGDIERTTEHLDDGRRFSLLQQLGLILSSGERHAQFAGRPPGWILHRLPCLERSLVIAAGDDRVPALTAELRASGTHIGLIHVRMRQNAPRVKKLLRSIRESGTSEYQLAGSLWRRAR